MNIDLAEKIENGWIHYNMVMEVQGNDKKHVQGALKGLTDKLAKETGTILLKQKLEKPEELRKGWFSVFADLELLSKGYDNLSKVCIQYSPSSLEILAPAQITIKATDLQSSMLDIAGMITTLVHAAYLARNPAVQRATQE